VPDPLEYLFGLEQFGMKFGLENIRTILTALDRPEQSFRAVHIAGTNGKGSVTAMVESGLRAAGHRTGRYTSPHLIELRERFAINGIPVPQPHLLAAIDRVRQQIETLIASGRLTAHPTFFEVTTAVAFELFREGGVEVAVCEVGLGGRLDATNVLSPVVCAITSIAMDHEQYLGSTLAAIAAEKAGIIKTGVPVVIGALPDDAESVIRRVARDRGAPLIDSQSVAVSPIGAPGGPTRRIHSVRRDYGEVRLNLAGEHQIGNSKVAIAVLEALDTAGITVPVEAVSRGLGHVSWPGRLERIELGDGRSALLDAAHNPDGARALATFLQTDVPRPLVFAAMRDKDARGILRELAPHVSRLVITRASSHRSAEPAALADVARQVAPELTITVEASPEAALAAAWHADAQIVIAGSIFLLGDVMKMLRRS
jgi:dihydrofolate synthase/folylpolyglutamate synthase